MELAVRVNGDTAHFQVSGTVDEKGAERLKIEFDGLSMDRLKSVIFDFSAVPFVGSAGLGKLLLFYKKLASRGISMRVENTTSELHELMRELRLDSLFLVT
mgnify:CR=1 FL=1